MMQAVILLLGATLFFAGDSTLDDYGRDLSHHPYASWGTELEQSMVAGNRVANFAKSGASTKSFVAEGRWEKLIAEVRPGDFVAIQFGHNDQKKSTPFYQEKRYADPNGLFREIVRDWVEEVRAKGATPILASPICRGQFERDGVHVVDGGLGAYRDAMREMSEELGCDFVDMNTLTKRLTERIGKKETEKFFVISTGIVKSKDGEPAQDVSHPIKAGAEAFARLFIDDVKARGLSVASLFRDRDFSIADFGAKTDGSKCTAAFAATFAAAERAGGGRVVVPRGRWFTGAVRFKSNCELHLEDGAEVVFSQDPADYLPAVHTSWEGMECWNYCPLVFAYCCTNVAISGTGTLKGYEGEWKDTSWYPWVWQDNGVRAARRQLYDWGATDCPVEKRQIWKMGNANTRPHLVQFNRCRGVRWRDFKVRNSPFWTLHLYQCEDASVRGLDVRAHGNNNDGIDIEMSRNVLVEKCRFDQGDDGIVIKSGRNRDAWRLDKPTENVLVRDCELVHGSTLLGVGSEISGGVRNVRMKDCRAHDVLRVFFLKTNRRRGGFLENITCENVTAEKVEHSVFEIATDILYEWARFPDYENKVTIVSNIVARNIHVGATRDLVRLVGDPRIPPRDIRVENVTAGKVSGKRCEVKNVYGYVEDGMPNLSKPRASVSEHPLVRSVYDGAFNRVVAADRACDALWTSAKTPEEVRTLQQKVRTKAEEALGGFPVRTPLNARTTGTVEREGYRIEKVIFESRPSFYVTGHLYVPTDSKFPGVRPAICAPCGHSFDGKSAPWYSNEGVVGARHGFVTFVYDPVDQGERYQKRDGRTSWDSVKEHNAIGLRAFLLGESAAQVRIFDGMRAVDYLASRTDIVNPKKIAVAGISGGGTLSSYINAFEPQVMAAAPTCFLSTIRDVYDNCGPQDAEQVIFGQLKFGLNHLGIACLRAPSPILVSAAHSDFFPFIGTTDMVEKAKRIFAAAGDEDNVALLDVPGPHHWHISQKLVQFDWLSRRLDGVADAVDAEFICRACLGYDYLEDRGGIAYDTPQERDVTATGRVLDIPGAKSIYDIYREKLAALRSSRSPVTPDAIRQVTGIARVADLSAEFVPAEGGAVIVRDDDGTMIPVVICRTGVPSGKPPKLVVSDVASRAELAEDVKGMLAQGHDVAIADVRGFGETSGFRHSFYESKNGDEEIAMCMMALGDSLVARRAEDIMLAARCVKDVLGKISILHAEGRAVIPAVHARYLEPQMFAGMETERTPPSWEELIADETMAYHFSCVVHNALAFYDWKELH